MDTFDFIIIGLGIALIGIGLFLFIAGKRESQHGNQVEGFGIKLNVSNPSIILIVFGIGLVLFPRIMPSNFIQGPSDEPRPGPSGPTVDPNDVKRIDPADPIILPDSPVVIPKIQPSSPTVFSPQGDWYLTQFQQNGFDLTNNLKGIIRFTPRNNNSQDWYAQFTTTDGWGDEYIYQYAGKINTSASGYSISIDTSDEPGFYPQGPSKLTMQMDNPNSLHMEYMFNGVSLIYHWAQ